MRTGEIVRESLLESMLVTERGRPLAVLKAAGAADLEGVPFPKRDLNKLPRVASDSTDYVSDDRDGR